MEPSKLAKVLMSVYVTITDDRSGKRGPGSDEDFHLDCCRYLNNLGVDDPVAVGRVIEALIPLCDPGEKPKGKRSKMFPNGRPTGSYSLFPGFKRRGKAGAE